MKGRGSVSTIGVKTVRSSYLHLEENSDAASSDRFRAWCEERAGQGEGLAVDLFSGAGGLSLGLEEAGWTVAASVDHYEAALETHRHNFGGLALDWDLGDEDVRNEFVAMFDGVEVDLVVGGPPCQPFSRAGRSKIRSLVDSGERSPIDPRKELWAAFLDIARRLKPRAILMENVPDMGLSDDFAVLRGITEILQKDGYETSINLANAWQFGVPQHRQRMILLARRDGKVMRWPEAQEPLKLKDVLGDLPKLNGGVGRRKMSYTTTAKTPFEQQMREGAGDVLHDHMTRAVRDDDLEIFKLMKTPKVLYSDVPKELQRYRADHFKDKYHRLDKNGLSRSITAHIAKDGYWYIHPWEDRTLTVREAARIQTFPDNFRFAGTRSDAFKQIGNAVPPLLGKAAASALAHSQPERVGYGSAAAKEMLLKWGVQQAKGMFEPWFPGPRVTDLAALAMALQARCYTSDKNLCDAVRPLLGQPVLTRTLFLRCIEAARTQGQRTKLARLGRLLPEQGGVSMQEMVDELTAVEGEIFDVLRGEDVLIRRQTPIRAAARILGTDSDKKNRGTNGLVDLATLVGSGEAAPIRMVALRLIGRLFCRPEAPDCQTCPLNEFCSFAETQDQDGSGESQPRLVAG